MKRQDGHIPWVVFILPASILCTKGRRSETPTSCNCISNSFSNTAAEPRSLQKSVLRHPQKKKNQRKEGFRCFCLWVELSWSQSWWDLGEKHSPWEIFVLRNSLFTTCKAEGAMRMVLKLFVTPEGMEEKKLDLIVFDYSFYSLHM